MRCRYCYYRWYCRDRGEAERKDSLEKCPNCADTRFDVLPRHDDDTETERAYRAVTVLALSLVAAVTALVAVLFL